MSHRKSNSRMSDWMWHRIINPLRPRQNDRHFAGDILSHIFLNENFRISTKISLRFAPKGAINNIPSLVQIMAWRRSGEKSLSEPMMVSLLTHICVTRTQWVNCRFFGIDGADGAPNWRWKVYEGIKYSLPRIAAWISNYINCDRRNMITSSTTRYYLCG